MIIPGFLTSRFIPSFVILCALATASCELCVSSAFGGQPLPQGTEWIVWTGPQEIILGTSQRRDLRSFIVPVYFGCPTRSYRIIGMVVEHGAIKAESEGRTAVVRSLAASAKAHGAEAILIQPLTSEIRAVIQARYPDESFYAFALAVRWRRPNDS
jgi:hypothetical protein